YGRCTRPKSDSKKLRSSRGSTICDGRLPMSQNPADTTAPQSTGETSAGDNCSRRRSLPFLGAIKDRNGVNVEMNHEDGYGYPDLAAAFGSSDQRIIRGILSQIINATMYGKSYDEDTLNFIVAVIKDNEPRNSTEAMILANIAALNDLAFKQLGRIADCED